MAYLSLEKQQNIADSEMSYVVGLPDLTIMFNSPLRPLENKKGRRIHFCRCY